MITETEKKEIDKKYFPNGFPYKVKTFDTYSYSNSKRFDEPFESLQEYEATVKSVRHSNGLRFFYLLKGLNETDFINEINNQYLNYTLENTENAKHWLSLTYDLVLKGFSVAGKIDDVNLRGAFIKWYNITLNDLEPQQPKAVIPDEVKPKKEFKDFFKTDMNIKVIEKIQNEFKEYYGKKMAVLIYLLQTDFKIISYSLDSKTDGRKHLVDSLNNSKPNMQPINKCFTTYSYNLDITNFTNDKDYINIKEKLLQTIK